MAIEKQQLQNKRLYDFQRKIMELRSASSEYLHTFLRDPLAYFLIKTLRFSVLGAFFFGLGLVVLTYSLRLLFYNWQNGGFALNEKTLIDLLYDLILVPTTYGYYIWISTQLPYITYRLYQNEVILKRQQGIKPLADLHQHRLNRPMVFFGAFLFMLILFLIHLTWLPLENWLWQPQASERIIFFLFKIPFTWLVPWYMVFVIFCKQLIFIFNFRKIYRLPDFQINLRHPDCCGGLKVLSDYLLHFTYYLMLCAFGIVLLAIRSIRSGYFQQDFLIQGAIVIYIPLCFFFFYFPLHPLNLLIKTMTKELSVKMKEIPFVPRWTFLPVAQRQFVLIIFSPFVFFFLLQMFLK